MFSKDHFLHIEVEIIIKGYEIINKKKEGKGSSDRKRMIDFNPALTFSSTPLSATLSQRRSNSVC